MLESNDYRWSCSKIWKEKKLLAIRKSYTWSSTIKHCRTFSCSKGFFFDIPKVYLRWLTWKSIYLFFAPKKIWFLHRSKLIVIHFSINRISNNAILIKFINYFIMSHLTSKYKSTPTYTFKSRNTSNCFLIKLWHHRIERNSFLRLSNISRILRIFAMRPNLWESSANS